MSTGEIIDELASTQRKLEVGGNLMIQTAAYASLGKLDSLDEDILRTAASVYAADLAVKRGAAEQHIRSITVRVPVVNLHAMALIRAQLEQAMTTLSRDNWTLEFIGAKGTPTQPRAWPKNKLSTLMFSGGLDSFVGAVTLLQNDPTLTLVSHVTHNRPVAAAQSDLAALVGKKTDPLHIQIPVWCRKRPNLDFPADGAREETQRTRSLLFVCLAAVATKLRGGRRIVVMSENGQFAIHLPLTEARIGSFSTHTAHPKFLLQMQETLRTLYQCPDLEVVNPFVNMTKGEVVALLPKNLRPEIKRSVSCWRTSRLSAGSTHCGECVPCLSRRIAIESNGLKIPEYKRDLLSEDIGRLLPNDLGKRNLSDLCQFVLDFAGSTALADSDVRLKYAELQDPVLRDPAIIAMYRRFATESLQVLGRYPYVKKLL